MPVKNKFPGAEKYLTPDIPAVDCTIRAFKVYEVPKFHPTGSGPHTWSLIEKFGMTTPQLVRILSKQIDAPLHDISYAGLKDKHARTIQWISTPKPVKPSEDFKLLVSKPSRKKLRPGALHGNWFRIDLETNEPQQVIDVLDIIESAVPNFFGPQRFGSCLNNHLVGKHLIQGNKEKARGMMTHARIPLTRRFYRLIEDAYLSYLFNRITSERIPNTQVHDYDIKSRHGPTAPMFGADTDFASGPQGELERSILKSEDVDFSKVKWSGGRRPMFVPLKGLRRQLTSNGINLKFFLPKGSYATSVLREITKESFTSPSLSFFGADA